MLSWNLVGTAIAILLIMVGLFIKFVYGMNLFYRYTAIDSSIKHRALISAKNITKKNKPNFRINDIFFNPVADCQKNRMNLKYRFMISNSIYDQVNCIFNAYLYNLNSKSKINNSLIAKILYVVSFLIAINIFWMLIFGLWIPVAALALILAVISITHIALQSRNISKAMKFTREYLKINEDAKNLKEAFSYLKYKRFSVITKYLSLYVEPIVSLITWFKGWGKDE